MTTFRFLPSITLARLFTLSSLALTLAGFSRLAVCGDWTTFGHDPQRSGWALEETAISPENASAMALKWKTALPNEPYSLSALTAPVVASGVSTVRGERTVVYVAGVSGTVFALDSETGEQLWKRTLNTLVRPVKGGYQMTFLCPNGITATPVIDKSTQILYVLAGDGALYGLDLGSGAIRYGPATFVAAYAKAWSLNLVNGVVYTTLSQGCGKGLSGVYGMDVRDRHHPVVHQLLLSNTDTAGIWGRGGPVIGDNGRVYGSTADGHFDPAAGDYSNLVISSALPEMKGVDYFLPLNWDYLRRKDLDLGSASPVYFGWKGRRLVASGTKESVVTLLDAESLGGADHQSALYTSPKWGNDADICCDGRGIWGGMASARDLKGDTWLYIPLGGALSTKAPAFPLTNGDAPHGSIMAFRVVAAPGTNNPVLEPAWVSGDFNLPDPPVVANGVLFALSTGENAVQQGGEQKRLLNTRPAVLRALDASTGKELFNSKDAIATWVHFSGLAVANGQVYVVDHGSNVYAFGIPAKK
ncbi:MAG TPA: PQQ-binding-like beta-propeller repeat protein [Bryobacteraceae bacterium]|jgi:outer membrane protein assembly factor BamB|nr:PQQ-binding-like beta-propeller repeat protein [Bryobacteraceae bacterium]